ncbi:TetR family transcriptional regulator [soil metagenome]
MSFDLCQRPRNAAATRAAILDAANARFLAESYDQVGMRDIARDVGVDPALISRYFGSKEDLFGSVLEDCGNGGELMDGDRATFGDRIAHDVIYGPRKEFKLRWLLLMLRSISSPKAAEVIQRQSNAKFYQPFTDWVGGEDAEIKARLTAGLIMGLTVSRDISGGFNLTPEQCERLHKRLAATLQEFIDS